MIIKCKVEATEMSFGGVISVSKAQEEESRAELYTGQGGSKYHRLDPSNINMDPGQG